ncbi:hypothetical protein EDC04DRAFT_778718 [Pisolithus marmoratus]|nr:hypothetical protein EDC04DRAFT_778718 [Pisolithus marmoratus]
MMHPCLSVDEILRLIFGYIEDNGSTLCALARTCRTFHEPAMDLIWETLTAFEPVLLSLPSARVISRADACMTLSRPLSDNDWSAVRRLSSRVRRLHMFLDPEPHYDNAVPPWFSFLTSPPDSSFLFPNLRRLSFEVPGYFGINHTKDSKEEFQAIIRIFRLLLGPHLSALRFEIPGSFYANLDLPSIPALSPNICILSMVSLEYYGVLDEAAYLFSRVVPELCNLEIVESEVTWDLLGGLAQAKALRKLEMYLPDQLGPGPDHPSGNIFPQLHTLDIQARSPSSCTDFFRWTCLNKVVEICVYFPAPEDDGESWQALVDMSSLVSLQCKALEFIWSSFSNVHPYDEIPSTCPRPALEPYQACHQLRVIALETPYSHTLTDNELEDIVTSWPHLEVFHLFQRGRESPLIRLTLRGVTALLHRCSKLTHFTLMFDATHVPEGATRRRSETLPPVKYMGVYRSPVSESSDVAAHISTIMPHLEIIDVATWHGYKPEWDWICTQHQRRPAIRVGRSPTTLYTLLTTGTEYISDYGREWEWKCW